MTLLKSGSTCKEATAGADATQPHRRAMRNQHMDLTERIELEASMRSGETQAWVAALLGRATGSISRELALNGPLSNLEEFV